jgi:hypothetical protein
LAADPAIKVRLVDLGGLVLPPSSPAEFGKLISDGQMISLLSRSTTTTGVFFGARPGSTED